MFVGVIGHAGQGTNPQLVEAWGELGIDVSLLEPEAAVAELGRGDVALFRLDVREALDGVEPGLEQADTLARSGVRVLNRPEALLGAHDKLETARRLLAAGVPHPRTAHLADVNDPLPLEPPLVLKPRFGSWGRDVVRCETLPEVRRRLAMLARRPWFERTGVLVQELLPAPGHDLRVVVAAGVVVGATMREAAPGEWRTNVSLGGRLRPAVLTDEARALSLAAVAAVGGELVGVDLLPEPSGRHVVLELNGAVEFDARYSLPGGDAYTDAAEALGLVSGRRESSIRRHARHAR